VCQEHRCHSAAAEFVANLELSQRGAAQPRYDFGPGGVVDAELVGYAV